MAKHKRPRTTPPLRPKRSELAQSLIDPLADDATPRTGIDVEPLFVALRIGALDDHLDEIATLVNARVAALNAALLDEPIGRFTNADLRVYATQLGPEVPSE